MKFKTPVFTAIFIMLMLTACVTISQPAQTIPAVVRVTLPPEPTLPRTTPTFSTPAIWSKYHNNQYGFSFEYPSAYDESSYQNSCGIKENNDGIHLGHQIDLLIFESKGMNTTEYASTILQTKGWMSDSLKNVTINGLEAVTVEYRFGGTNRFGTFTLIDHNSHLFALNFSAGSFCDIPEATVSEPEAYAHILETFQFDP